MKHLTITPSFESFSASEVEAPEVNDQDVVVITTELEEEQESFDTAATALESLAKSLCLGMSQSIAMEALDSCPGMAHSVRYSKLTMSPSLEGLVPALEALDEERESILSRVVAAIVKAYKRFIAWVSEKLKQLANSKGVSYFRKNKAGDKAAEYGAKASTDPKTQASAITSVVSEASKEVVSEKVATELESLKAKYETFVEQLNTKPSLILVMSKPEVVAALFAKAKDWSEVIESATATQTSINQALARANSGGTSAEYIENLKALVAKFISPLPGKEKMDSERVVMPEEGSGKLTLKELDLKALCSEFSKVVLENHLIANIDNHTRKFEALARALEAFEQTVGRKRFPKTYSTSERTECINETKAAIQAISSYLNYAMRDMASAATVYDAVQSVGSRLGVINQSVTTSLAAIAQSATTEEDKKAISSFFEKTAGTQA